MSDVAARYGRVLDRIGEWHHSGSGVVFRCPFGTRHRNGDQHPSGRAKLGRNGQLVIRCFGCGAVAADFARHCGMFVGDFFADSRTMEHRPMTPQRCTARYDYHAADGALIATKLRLEPGYGGSKKSFVWQRPIPDELTKARGLPAGVAQGLAQGRYTPGRIVDGVQIYFPVDPAEDRPVTVELPGVTDRVGLYRLPQLLAAPYEAPVFFTEGEGKADLIATFGLAAAAVPHGASYWDDAWCEHFAGRRVVVIPDDDHPGAGHARRVAGSLAFRGVQEIRILERSDRTHGWPAGGDVKDWLLSIVGGISERKAALVAACKGSPTYTFNQQRVAA